MTEGGTDVSSRERKDEGLYVFVLHNHHSACRCHRRTLCPAQAQAQAHAHANLSGSAVQGSGFEGLSAIVIGKLWPLQPLRERFGVPQRRGVPRQDL